MVDPQLSLTPSTPPSGRRPATSSVPVSAWLVTNHRNLLFMLAASLVLPRAAFGAKHYHDAQGDYPGWVPLFLGPAPPAAALTRATSEAKFLLPVVVEIALSQLKGRIFAVDDAGAVKEFEFPEEFDDGKQVLLVPAPLPTTMIDKILFQSATDRAACIESARDVSNVPLADFKIGLIKRKAFWSGSSTPWPPAASGPPKREAELAPAQAAGGVMAMLLRLGNRSDLALRTCRAAFDGTNDGLDPIDDAILAPLVPWAASGRVEPLRASGGSTDRSAEGDISHQMLFWGALNRVIRSHGAMSEPVPEEALRVFIDESIGGLPQQAQRGARALLETLKSLTRLTDATSTELFRRHPTTMARALILYHLRSNCVELLDFENDLLDERDWLAAAILFGARDGWLGLPLELRAIPGLAPAVSHRMAELAHRMAGTDLRFGERPPRVRPLRELLANSAVGTREGRVAVEVARTMKWDCIHSRIRLPKGEHKLHVGSGAPIIHMRGEPTVDSRVDVQEFLKLLAAVRLKPEVERRAREALGPSVSRR